jgi:hypothetical protein
MKTDWNHRLEELVLAGYLIEDWKKNILRLLDSSGTVAREKGSVRELVEAAAWVKSQGKNLFFVQTCLGMRTIIRS